MGDSRTLRILFKWVGFVCILWVQAIAGNNYSFANYASDLKHVLGYSQVELNTLSVAKDVGKSLGLLAGLLSEYFRPEAILLIGAGVGALGYGSTWLIIGQHVAPPTLWQMCVVMFMGGNSSTWMNTACLTTCLRNFPNSRGPAIGILKGFVGLSSAIFTVICSSLFNGASEAFVLLLTFVPVFTCMVAAIFLREIPPSTGREEDLEEKKCFSYLNISAITIAVYLLGYSLSEEALSPPIKRCVSWVLLLLLLSPIIVPGRLLLYDWFIVQGKNKRWWALAKFHHRCIPESNDLLKEPLLHSGVVAVTAAAEAQQANPNEFASNKNCKALVPQEGEFPSESRKAKQLGDNFTLWEALATLDFWILFVGFLAGVGAGVATINNVAQIGESLGFDDVTMFVSLISIFGFFGRLCSGTLSEYFFRSRAIPRTAWMAASKILMILGYLVLAFPITGSLHLGSILVGSSFGFHVTLMVPVASEMFGLKSFGLIYNVLNMGMSLGSFLLSYLAGYLYDYESERATTASMMPDSYTLVDSNHGVFLSHLARFSSLAAEGETECYGSYCFRLLFLVMCLVLGFGFILDVTLTFRLRILYKKLAKIKRRCDSGSETTREKPGV